MIRRIGYSIGFAIGYVLAEVLWTIPPLRPRLTLWVLNRQLARNGVYNGTHSD